MNPNRPSKWDNWRLFVEKRCERLVLDLGYNSPPVPLHDLARKRRIRNVIFRPLLVEGGTAATGDGFKVYVRCEKENVASWSASFETDGGVALPNRTRFSIAHEIVHTFFFDRRNGRPTSKFKVQHYRVIKSLEKACDLGASLLLLPTHMLWRELAKIDPFLPDDIIQLAKKFAVSPHVLISRLNRLGNWDSARGLVTLINYVAGVPTIQAVTMTGAVSGIFPNAAPGLPAKDLIWDEKLLLYGGRETQLSGGIQCVVGSRRAVQPFVVACSQLYRRPVSTYILTIKLQGEPKRTSVDRTITERGHISDLQVISE